MTWPLTAAGPGTTPALRFAVIGWPVSHSLSPAMHRAAFRVAGARHGYDAVAVEPASLPAFLERLRSEPGWGGVNVTVPHKEAALAAADDAGEVAREVGAANVLTVAAGEHGGVARLLADNTDAPALLAVLQRHLKPVGRGTGSSAVLVGAGGAARAALWALARAGTRRVAVAARRPEQARALVEDLAGRLALPACRALDLAHVDALRAALEEADVVVQATPVGLSDPDASPLPDAAWPEGAGGLVLDLVYGGDPGKPRLLARQAAARGWTYCDGLGMLVEQAALSWVPWFGREADRDTMRRAAGEALTATHR